MPTHVRPLKLINAECPQGQFGENCLQYCSNHCVISGKCDIVTGHCIGGCKPGWKPTQCDQSKNLQLFTQFSSTISICKIPAIDYYHQRIDHY